MEDVRSIYKQVRPYSVLEFKTWKEERMSVMCAWIQIARCLPTDLALIQGATCLREG